MNIQQFTIMTCCVYARTGRVLALVSIGFGYLAGTFPPNELFAFSYEKAAVPVPLKVKRCLVGDDDDNRSNVSDTWKDDYVDIDFSSPVKPKYNRNTTLTRAEAVRTTLEFVKDLPTYEADHPLVTCSVVRAAVKLKYGFVPKASFTSDACKATIDAHATAQLHKDTKNYRRT
ncbi:hypothetical protein DYB26_014145 [Aphanomyces astaci]|uniref:Uncharacterized protein n=1 Tax=Aphanomyces astaci TaxID=112090 RepID=A0A3R6Z7A3_APHAT|nr:hypothetical protein DYB26_014145 [Aphanomyces astaci]